MRLIDADAMMETLKRKYPQWYTGKPKDSWMHYVCLVYYWAVKESPTIDAVPVVRCKDCRHRIKWNDSFGCAFWGYYGDEFADGEMFCRKGERKDDD